MTTNSENVTDEIMCTCSGTTRGKIKILFEQGMDMEDISGWTGAISGCGGCEWDVALFMQELAEQKINCRQLVD